MTLNLKQLQEKYPEIAKEFTELSFRLAEVDKTTKAKKDFLSFVKFLWPDFIEGAHHRKYAKKLQEVAEGKCKRLIINMAPRHTKSEFASYLFPAFMMGLNPRLKLIQGTHTAELSQRFGRKIRNLIDSEEYQQVFDDVLLRPDSKSAGRWETNHGGEAFFCGVGGAMTGRGGDLIILDDVHSEQDAMSPTAMENAWDWYLSGPRQRCQPNAAIVIVMTRWSEKDLTGKLLKAQVEPRADQWDVLELPAILDNEKPLWPEYWKIEELLKVKATLPANRWNAQYMQDPTSDEASIIKREWWKIWEKEKVPHLHSVIQSYDTAFSKKETADFSAITTWGIFTPIEGGPPGIMLLDAEQGRWDFPELKKMAIEQYNFWEPEMVLIESKASGTPLMHELRQLGMNVIPYTPTRGNDKHVRANSVAPLFEAGRVWAPANREFAEEVIEQCAKFPFGEHDDLVDSTTQALIRFRTGNFVTLDTDYEDEPVNDPPAEFY